MQKTLFALSLGFAGLILATHAGWAAPQCGPRDQVVAMLAQNYGESRHGIGLSGSTQVMELFANLQTGSWTILVTLPEGASCLVASGQQFEEVAEPQPAKGSPT